MITATHITTITIIRISGMTTTGDTATRTA
jgi:hypothetical protein